MDISAEIAEAIPTTLSISFTTQTPGLAWVEYAVNGGAWQQTPPSTATDTAHQIPVIAGSLADVELQIVAELDGERHESGIFTAQSGGLLPGTPILSITTHSYSPPAGTRLLMSVFGTTAYVVLADLDGNVEWALPQGSPEENLRGGLSVEPSVLHPNELIFNTYNPDDHDGLLAEIWRVNLFGEVVERISTPGAHHFFTQTPDGDLLWLRGEIRVDDGLTIQGDEIRRYTLATGAETSFFSTWDALDLPQNLPADGWFDWTHANWLTYNSARDSYLLSTAKANTLVELSPEGSPLHIFNGFASADVRYQYDDIDEAFAYPHGVHWAADSASLLVFSTAKQQSHAARYTFDDAQQTIQRVWEYGTDLDQEALVLGEVQELDDGNYLVSWGGLGILQIVDPYGAVLWEAQTALGDFFSQVHLTTDPYRPLDR